MFVNLNMDLYVVCIIFRCIVGGAEHRHENLLRKSPLELCSDQFEENQSTRRAWRTCKLMKVAHNICKSITIWLKIKTVQSTWYEERLCIDPCTSCCWSVHRFAINVRWLWEFTSLNTFCHHWCFLYTDDLAFTLWVMFSLKDFVLLLRQWTYF